MPHSLMPSSASPAPRMLVVLLGPTGVGKTALSLALAERLGCPILNADSRQIYRHMPIGTAAPTPAERQRVHHYFVEELEPDDYFSAARYETEALKVLEREFSQRPVCLMAGGSMMYLDAVCHGIDDIPTIDNDTRQLLRQRYEREGLQPLVEELRLLDPTYYAQVDLRNPKRVVHALEVCYMTGRTFTSYRLGRRVQRPFGILKIGLNLPREELFARINSRVWHMVEAGLADEARSLLPYRHCNALNTVGYKEMFRHLDGEWTLEQAVLKIQRNTRVYAKKQLTWFAKDQSIHWLRPDDLDGALQRIAEGMKQQDSI